MGEQAVKAAQLELTSVEVVETQEAAVVLEDQLEEMVSLKRRLREVRDLEERLQEVDEMAERLQEVIEEELGAEEVARLREEEDEEELEQKRSKTWGAITLPNVLTKSMTSKEEEEVDELEEQIKSVFLKGLLPEEDEAKVKLENPKKGSDETLLEDRWSEKLRQMEPEWEEEMEFVASGVSTTTVAAYETEEQRFMKRVGIVWERGRQQEDTEDVQGRSEVTLEKRLQTQTIWQKTETLEGRMEEEVTERAEAEGQRQVGEKDVWFVLFDQRSDTAAVRPSGTVCHCASFCSLKYHIETLSMV